MSSRKKNCVYVVRSPPCTTSSEICNALAELHNKLQFLDNPKVSPVYRDDVDGVVYFCVDLEEKNGRSKEEEKRQ